jgi:hypothetical protein
VAGEAACEEERGGESEQSEDGSLAGRAAEEGAAGNPAPCVKTGCRDASQGVATGGFCSGEKN